MCFTDNSVVVCISSTNQACLMYLELLTDESFSAWLYGPWVLYLQKQFMVEDAHRQNSLRQIETIHHHLVKIRQLQ